MKPYLSVPGVDIFHGDCRAVLRALPAASVQTCVTSPPYFGLRDYGCDGQIGLEPTPAEYVATMVEVFGEVRRVLRDDGTVWLNLGDSYAGSWGAQSRGDFYPGTLDGASDRETCLSARQIKAHPKGTHTGSLKSTPGLKAKDLIGIPWRVAFALQADGWYLRSDIIWAKSNPMPESVTDRPTKAHEYLFLLAKSDRYYYDAKAIAEPCEGTGGAAFGKVHMADDAEAGGAQARRCTMADRQRYIDQGRNKRSVWTVGVNAYPGAHFATFPPDLIEPCILAGTSERGCCRSCGAPWMRQVEHVKGDSEAAARPKRTAGMDSRTSTLSLSGNGSKEWAERGGKSRTVGWQPSCDCNAGDPTGCAVLDPFNGSGTTGAVCQKWGRRYVGIELNAAYIDLSAERFRQGVLFSPEAEPAPHDYSPEAPVGDGLRFCYLAHGPSLADAGAGGKGRGNKGGGRG